MELELEPVAGTFAVLRLEPGAPLPDCEWFAATRTPDELSLIVREADAASLDARVETGFFAWRVRGPLPFDAVGVLAGLAEPLRTARIPLLAVSTFETDYVFVRDADGARRAWAASGIRVT